MVELYLKAKLHSRISVDTYRTVLMLQELDDQDLRLRSICSVRWTTARSD